MNHSFLRTQPAKLRMLRKPLRDRAKTCHQFFNFHANQFLAEPFNSFANQLVAQAERKHDPGAENLLIAAEQRGSKCVLGSGVHGVAARAFLQREANVACLQ